MEAFLISVLGEKVYVYGMFTFFGIVFGAVPLVFSIMRKIVPLGILSMIACIAVSVLGFSYFSPVVAIVAFLWLDQYSAKKQKEQKAKNRKKYNAAIKEKIANEAKEGRVYQPNADAELTAWPPISKVVDEEALEQYNKMVAAEEKNVDKWTTTPDDSEKNED